MIKHQTLNAGCGVEAAAHCSRRARGLWAAAVLSVHIDGDSSFSKCQWQR